MHELGLLEAFLKRPHQKVNELKAIIDGREVKVADFSHLPVHCRFIALMPQWDFLNFLAEEAGKYPHFHLHRETKAVRLLENSGRVTGVSAVAKDGPLEFRADLVVAADGRHSEMRQAAKLEVIEAGAPIDVLWMRISRHADDPEATAGRIAEGHILVTINRNDYWQCAFVVPKNGYGSIRAAGLDAFHEQMVKIAPFLRGRIAELDSWEKISLLTVTVNRLRRWAEPGLLCIGDAAHAMSPVGGVGINLAVQDAVATANLMAQPLQKGAPTPEQLNAVQERREWPTKMTQRVQVFIQDNILAHALTHSDEKSEKKDTPVLLRVLQNLPFLGRIPARLFGMGFRPEHVADFLCGANGSGPQKENAPSPA
jgi:2-polyprenyl-6-methoxyphenol hydroxylase-like FAD-dependent oxidoreductase